MISKISLGVVAGAVSLVIGSGFAFAGGDDAIKARQACMKANGADMKVMVPMIKGEAPYDAAAVQATLAASETACAKWSEFWPEDSMTSTTVKTKALDAIWKDPKGFEAAGAAYYKAFTDLKATKDEAGFKAAFGAFGETCKGCHEKFRAAEK
jgi:cytochrome c556